jgi:hypothetical protein
MPKKNKDKKIKEIKELSQAHGMVEKESYEPTTLDQIWGDDGSKSRYNTLNPEEYERWVDEQDKSTLQTHAASVGLLPVDHAGELKKRLLREFWIHRSKYTKPLSTSNELPRLDREARDILAEGK